MDNLRKKSAKIDVERAKISPADEFDHPQQVVDHSSLRKEDKKKILNQWQTDADALSRANDEGMSGGESTKLDEVQGAQRKLDKTTSPKSGKHR
jgi:Fe-S cluster assembly ATPase SufC